MRGRRRSVLLDFLLAPKESVRSTLHAGHGRLPNFLHPVSKTSNFFCSTSGGLHHTPALWAEVAYTYGLRDDYKSVSIEHYIFLVLFNVESRSYHSSIFFSLVIASVPDAAPLTPPIIEASFGPRTSILCHNHCYFAKGTSHAQKMFLTSETSSRSIHRRQKKQSQQHKLACDVIMAIEGGNSSNPRLMGHYQHITRYHH